MSHTHGTASLEDSPSDPDECSASSEEDKPELASRQCLNVFLANVVSGYDPIESHGNNYDLTSYVEPTYPGIYQS
jgi:hypothetical protein